MKIKSISGFTLNVQDLEKSAQFYESLGLRAGKREADHAIFYINWFWVELVESASEKKESDLRIAVNVEDVDEFYKGVIELGYQPDSEPADQTWGRREFMLQDPDGYKLAFFQK
jgi:catechol 2,3-dioxygenase-like lactoylglutathione lyase family enzyme